MVPGCGGRLVVAVWRRRTGGGLGGEMMVTVPGVTGGGRTHQ